MTKKEISQAAALLGSRNKGKQKTISPELAKRRRADLAKVRCLRWPTVDQPTARPATRSQAGATRTRAKGMKV